MLEGSGSGLALAHIISESQEWHCKTWYHFKGVWAIYIGLYMIETVAILLAVLGIVFAFETPRRKFLSLFGHHAIRTKPQNSSVRVSVPQPPVHGATQSGRHPFFIREPYATIPDAQEKARKTGKPIFLVIYDQEHPTLSKLYYSLGCFLDYFTTKKLVDDHFVSALVPVSSIGARDLVPPDDPLEKALWVVLNAKGEVIKREGVYANPDEGLKRVRQVIASSDAV